MMYASRSTFVAPFGSHRARSRFSRWTTCRSLVAALLGMTGVAPLSAQRSPCDPARARALVASRDLYCLSLVASPDGPGASGHVELGRAPDPFTIAVTAD